MIASDNKIGFKSPVVRIVLPMLVIAGLVWFNFGHQPVSGESPSHLIPDQPVSTATLPVFEQVPEPSIDFARKIAKVPVKSKAEVSPGPEEEAIKEQPFVMPEWEKIFNGDGTLKDEVNVSGRLVSNGVPDYIDLYRGDMSRFIREIISNGLATDMSAFIGADKISDQILYNGPVDAAYDLGNVYFMTSRDVEGGSRLFTAVGRLSRQESTFIEFEFNQIPLSLGSGTPWWRLKGDRIDGDLSVRMEFRAGALSGVQILEWREDAFEVTRTFPGLYFDGCHKGAAIIYCVTPSRISEEPEEGFEVWDENFVIVEPTQPDELVELAIDVPKLLGTQVDFRSLVIRTPRDIAINTFKRADRDISLAGLSRREKSVQ